MQWQLGAWVASGEIDNRVKGRVTGHITFAGEGHTVCFELEGDCLRDLAGCLIRFENPNATPLPFCPFAEEQTGKTGEITAKRLCQNVQDGEDEESPKLQRVFYLEWFTAEGHRLLVEGTGFAVSVIDNSWQMSVAEDERQRRVNGERLQRFLEETVPGEEVMPDKANLNEEEAIEQMLRLTDLRHEVEKLGGTSGGGEDGPKLPPSIEESFLQNLLFFENAPQMKRRDVLRLDGFEPRHPDDIPFEEIEDALWALIHALARRRNFLENTDHLSDEQLYDVLWEQVLEEPTSVFPECCRWSCEISICDYGSPNGDDGLITFLRHYADEHFRREWEQEFPDQPLPVHRDPPYERDYLLPAPDRFLDEEQDEE